ncbi:MAG: hypothetical protein SF162_15565 [bacterium]|nr:hypothetical protein [bacterium]
MVYRLWTALLILPPLFTLAISAAVGFGQAQPPGVGTDFFSANSCALPCIYGITLGESTRADTVQHVQGFSDSILAPLGAPIIFTTFHAGQRAIDGAFDFGGMMGGAGDTVLAGQFYANDGSRLWTLGELLLMGHDPQQVRRSCSGVYPPRLILNFEQGDLTAGLLLTEPRLTPQTPVILLYIAHQLPMYLQAQRNFFAIGCSVETEWRGFAPLAWYFER